MNTATEQTAPATIEVKMKTMELAGALSIWMLLASIALQAVWVHSVVGLTQLAIATGALAVFPAGAGVLMWCHLKRRKAKRTIVTSEKTIPETFEVKTLAVKFFAVYVISLGFALATYVAGLVYYGVDSVWLAIAAGVCVLAVLATGGVLLRKHVG